MGRGFTRLVIAAVHAESCILPLSRRIGWRTLSDVHTKGWEKGTAMRLTTGQIGELIAIDRAGSGIGEHVQELISRLTSGGVAGKSGDSREVHAKRLWDLGVGKELGFENYGAWLQSLPPVPERPQDEQLSILVLVPDRSKIGIVKSCQLLGVAFSGSDETFADAQPDKALSGTYWIWCQDGGEYRSKKPKDCRDKLFPQENQVALTAHEGLWIYAVDGSVLTRHYIDLPGSVHAGSRDGIACLELSGGEPELRWARVGFVHGHFGSASRGSVNT